MWCVYIVLLCACAVVRTQVIPGKSRTSDGDYNSVNTDGSFDFGYSNKDVGSSYHVAHAGPNRVVGGRFGAKDPATGTIKETVYTAGPRGFRAKGPNIHRKMDLDQRPRGPIGNRDDPYADPSEDPSYSYSLNTRTFSKNENADRRGDVKGQYSYVDDVGERHNVRYVAGRDTGFHVTSSVPDNPAAIGAPFHRQPLVRGESKQRGRTAVQRGLDGSYRFISAGPDQRRTESSDAHGNVRGSYTFLDDKGVQRTVHYIAGPGIGYRIVKSGTDPHIPGYFPAAPTPYDPDFADAISYGGGARRGGAGPSSGDDDVFTGPDGSAASGHPKPAPFPNSDKDGRRKPVTSSTPRPVDDLHPSGGHSPVPSYDEDASTYPDDDDHDTKFSSGSKPTQAGKRPTSRPKIRPTKKPYVPKKPTQDFDEKSNEDFGKGKSSGPEYGIGFNIDHSKPGTTIIRNIGQDFFGVPPGVSVRAHVQSIDLYPYDSKKITPSEAREKDKT